MKKFILFSTFIGLVFWAGTIPAQNTFEFELDYPIRKYSSDALFDNHGNIITVVNERTGTDYAPTELTKSYILRFSPNGDTLTHHFSLHDTVFNFFRITPSLHNGYLLCGVAKIYETEQTFLLLMEVDTAFNPIWVKFHDYSEFYLIFMGKPFIIGNKYLIGLNYCLFPCGAQTTGLSWIDEFGNIEQQYIHPIQAYSTSKFMMNHDSTHIWAFNRGFFGSNGQASRAVFDISLNFISLDNLASTDDYITTKWQTDSTFLYATDYVRPNAENPNDREVYIIKYDSLLSIRKSVYFGALDTIDQASNRQTMDFKHPDTVFFLGLKNQTIGIPWPQEVSWIMTGQVDADLNLRYLHFMGGDGYYETDYIFATPDGGSFICAHKYNQETKVSNPIFLKLNNEGLLVGSSEKTIPISNALIYPNPAQDQLTIECYYESIIIRLYDSRGILLFEKVGSAGKTSLGLTDIKPGNYYVRIHSKDGQIIEGKSIIKL